jgi:translation initiation factor 1
VVYSSDPDFEYDSGEREEQETPPPDRQLLYVRRDRKKRKGRTVTIVEGFTGKREDLECLGKSLKTGCGAGGTTKEGEIIVQGDFRERIFEILQKKGYKVKRKGG